MWANAKALFKNSPNRLNTGMCAGIALTLAACGGGDARTPFLWQNRLGADVIVQDTLITDAEGNTYRGYLRAGQAWLRKMGSTGTTLWETPINDTPIDTSLVVDLHLFATSNSVLAVMGVPGLNNVTLQRTGFDGTTQWETTLDEFHGSLFNVNFLAADTQGNTYIVDTSGQGESTTMSLFKVSAQGTLEWTSHLNDCDQCVEGIKIVGQQPVYLRRQTSGHTLVALNAAGDVRWQQNFAGTGYWYNLSAAGDMTVLWGHDALQTFDSNGAPLGAQSLRVVGAPLWNGENTLYVPTETQLLAIDSQTNVLHSLNFPIDSPSTGYTPIVSTLQWHPTRRQLAFIQAREDYKSATVYGRHNILIYNEALELQQTFEGATNVVTPCGLPGCYIPRAYGDNWESVAFVGNNNIAVSGVRQGEGYYTGAYQLR